MTYPRRPPPPYIVKARQRSPQNAATLPARPAAGTLSAYELPSGRGLRVEGFGYAGYRTGLRFDSLLAKLIVSSPSADFGQLAERASTEGFSFLDGMRLLAGFPRFVNGGGEDAAVRHDMPHALVHSSTPPSL